MKRITFLISLMVFTINVSAKPVALLDAKLVAQMFYNQNSRIEITSITLAYTELSTKGIPLFYAFNINATNGFVIVSADDMIKPIIGYSTENSFVIPKANTTIAYWLKEYSTAMSVMQTSGFVPEKEVAKEWTKYAAASNSKASSNISGSVMSSVAPLVQSTWDQSPYYNASCPGGSITGCVATAMAQIMRFWSYPTQGTGSSSYCDCTANGYQNTYGTLSANYGAATYNWANMPLSNSNSDIATLMYHCGVSVAMDYSPSESSAYVLTIDKPVCSQSAYINYFKYNPYTLRGIARSHYTDTQWIQILENEFINGRPVQYLAQDLTNGGHSWVADGFDANNNFHMNWGWGGYDNGYYAINILNPSPYNFSADHEALIGIVPLSVALNEAGVTAISAPITGCNDTLINPIITLQNYGSSTLTSCVINYQVDNNTLQTFNWTGSISSGQTINVGLPSFTTTVGGHTFNCYSSNPNNSTGGNFTTGLSSINFFIESDAALPIIEGFETTTSLPNSVWNISHTATTGGVDFVVNSNTAATGTKSIMIDNINNVAGNNSIIQTASSYNLSTFNTPSLSFKAAYQQKATTNNDKLQIYVSTDCGASWMSRRAISSTALAALSGGIGTVAYIPTTAQFTTYTVSLSPVINSTHVMFRWEFYADPNSPGNNLYIDDINIVDATSGINDIEAKVNLNIYPNPSYGIINVDFNLYEQHTISASVNDMLGRVVESVSAKIYTAGESTITIGSNAYQKGIYMVNINIDEQLIVRKIIIQ